MLLTYLFIRLVILLQITLQFSVLQDGSANKGLFIGLSNPQLKLGCLISLCLCLLSVVHIHVLLNPGLFWLIFFLILDVTVAGGESGITFTYTRDGRPSGEAYVALISHNDQMQALNHNKEHIGSRYIEGSCKYDVIMSFNILYINNYVYLNKVACL